MAEALGHSRTRIESRCSSSIDDSNWWVRYYSANSLSNMGMKASMRCAKQRWRPTIHFKSDMAKDRIHKELLREHFFAGRREQGAGYQPKRIIYEQYFGEAAIAPLSWQGRRRLFCLEICCLSMASSSCTTSLLSTLFISA